MMKLNPECVRDVLLMVEENTEYPKIDLLLEGNMSSELSIFDKYEENEVFYHINQCLSSGLVKGNSDILGGFLLEDLTPKGHDLLNKIRDEKAWTAIMKKGVSSIPAIIAAACEIYSAFHR